MHKFSAPSCTSVPRALGNLRIIVQYRSLYGRIPYGFPTLLQRGKSRTNVTTTPEVFTMPKPLRCATDPPSFNHTAHRDLWLWLSENPERWKEDWPGWKSYRNIPYQLCFACQYTVDVIQHYSLQRKIGCDLCPLEWPGKRCIFGTSIGLYDIWSESSPSSHVRRKTARDIAELPVKDGIIYI